MTDAMHSWKFCYFLSVFHVFLVSFDCFLTTFDSLSPEKSCRIRPIFQRPGVCSVLALFSDRCLFPALEQHDRRKATESMWRVCSKDAEMNRFNQLTFQSGKACLWVWILCGIHFFLPIFLLLPFSRGSEIESYLRVETFRTQGFSGQTPGAISSR